MQSESSYRARCILGAISLRFLHLNVSSPTQDGAAIGLHLSPKSRLFYLIVTMSLAAKHTLTHSFCVDARVVLALPLILNWNELQARQVLERLSYHLSLGD